MQYMVYPETVQDYKYDYYTIMYIVLLHAVALKYIGGLILYRIA